jgi:signal transduction histidine kinase
VANLAWPPTPLIVLHIVVVAIVLALAVHAWRHRSKPGAEWFAVMMAAVGVWAAAQLAAKAYAPLTTDPVINATVWFVSVLGALSWLAFAMEYTGREQLLSWWLLLAMAILPSITAAQALLGDPFELLLTGRCYVTFDPAIGFLTADCQLGEWALLHVVYGYVLVVLGAGLLVATAVRSDSVYGDQAAALLVGVLVPLLASVSWVLELFPLRDYDPTPAAFAVSGIAFWHAISRYRFMDVIPATRRIGEAAALEDLNDGVVIVDDADQVLRMNPAASELFGRDPDAVVGDPLEDVLGKESFTVDPGELVATFATAVERRTLQVTVSPITDRQDEKIGHTLVFRDVTEREQRKQQLAALNRVLRHNLRNDLNVVQGYADTLSERTTDPEAEMAEQIAEQSADLVEVGSKVRDMEKIMDRPRSEYDRFEVAELLRDVVDEVRSDHPEARMILDLSPDLWIRSDDLVAGIVVENLVRNAIEHDPTDPEVTVVGTVDDGWVTITIEDDGPGIPDQEREALLQGEETDLRHGSGLGLWVVNWGVTKLGGDLSFENPAGGGTRVTVRLPGATDPPGESTDGTDDPPLDARTT